MEKNQNFEKYKVNRGFNDYGSDAYIIDFTEEFDTLEKAEEYYNSRKDGLYECEFLEIVYKNEVIKFCDEIGE